MNEHSELDTGNEEKSPEVTELDEEGLAEVVGGYEPAPPPCCG